MQRIVRSQAGILLDPVLAVEQRQQPLARRQPEVMRALRADTEALDEVARVDDRVAVGTLDPQSLGHAAGFVRRGNRLARLFEPGHRASLAETAQSFVRGT